MTYRSIFLDPDWVHVRHLGWSDADRPDADMRVMRRRDGPVTRHLVVSQMTEPVPDLIAAALAGRRGLLSEVTWHDLSGSAAVAQLLAHHGLRPLEHGRMLNRHTIVFDLAQDNDALLAQMNSDTRRKLRQAEKAGVVCRSDCHRDAALVERFLAAHDALAHDRGLARLTPALVAQIMAARRGRLAAAFSADHDSAAFVLSYEAGGTGFFLHGASDGPPDPLLGRAVHWHLIGALRDDGLRWYDFGGLPSTDPANGITRFKLGFGGTRIDLGPEYRWSGALMPLARAAARLRG